ncbi:prolipoprotein diacylglyceryl transferase [Demequina sp. TTPB684]|uniref:prolipoprotein diacylglyceryl transferase n=1 Tax=unclassified Demequina TaxID=2620311 RepID=UPI001CF37751|nr:MULTISPECIES: prolipoprotein diacylglyceryl transferase [unclassified Demequina]MCB2412692.1 prolipoprotein diacylglyceryl transferase [Demequina sp. TTPB684]UPU87668.1 prolipoprotein diacylglyceryl transferase [Demequina sp. TMPB413]
MQPVLFSILGLDIQTYGISKAAAAVVAAILLGRAFRRHGLNKDDAYTFVLWATVWGFVGAKIYYLLENASTLTAHHLGGMGFTWYGGLLGGIASALVVMRRRHLPAATVADAAMIPLSVAYAIGRIGCWLSGDGTYGKPTSLPWGMPVTHGVVPTDVAVHPTPLYEALGALAIAALLWTLARRQPPPLAVVAGYLFLSGVARVAVEFLRINEPALWGLTQPQLWSIASIAAGLALGVAVARRGRRPVDDAPDGPLRPHKSSSKVDVMPVESAGPSTQTDRVQTP